MKDHLVNHLLYYNDNVNGEFNLIIDNIKKQIDYVDGCDDCDVIFVNERI